LILSKIVKIVATRCHILRLKCTQTPPSDPLAGFKGSYFQGKGRGGRTGVRRRGEGFFIIFKHSWAPKRSWKISHGGPGKSWKSPGFLCQ